MSGSSEPIIVERAFNVSPGELWEAITDHQQMVAWFFEDIPEFRAEAGFQTQFPVFSGQRQFTHLWKITESVSGSRIVFDWRYAEYPGVGKVTFEVFEDSDGSRLRVTDEVLESFPREVPEFARESCEGGWEYFLQGRLKTYLEGR